MYKESDYCISLASAQKFCISKNSPSSHDTTYILDPHVSLGGVQPYVEVISVQPGMYLHITKIPANTQLDIAFDVQSAPFSLECWLQGCMEYSYTSDNGDKVITGKNLAKAGQILFGSAGKEYGIARKIGSDPIEVVQLMLDPALLHMTLNRSLQNCRLNYYDYIYKSSKDHHFASVPIPAAVWPLVKNIAACPLQAPMRQLVLANKAHELFYTIIMELFLAPSTQNPSTVQPEDIAKFQRIKDLIEHNLDKPLSHRQIAKEVGINEFKLKRGFKELFGSTVYGYLLEKRMHKAKNLLETGTNTVSDVAWDIGYTNVSHFIAVFRKYHGVTPGKFLASVRQRLGALSH